MEKINYRLLKHFGPSVFKVKLPSNMIEDINNYVDNIIDNSEKSAKLNHGENLVGDVTQEFRLEQEFMQKIGWGDFLAKCVGQWILMDLNKKITKFKMLSSWVVRQFESEYNPIHWHGGHISGAGFLKVPKSLGKYVQNKKSQDYSGGCLQLVHGSRMFMSQSVLSIIPEVGDFYFFPNYLMHSVFPFKDSKEERRSISFNATIDEEIYNVYGN